MIEANTIINKSQAFAGMNLAFSSRVGSAITPQRDFGKGLGF
jgi:hypothetical protein